MNASGLGHRQYVVGSIIAAVLLLGGIASAAYSLYWFAQAQEPKAKLTQMERQRQDLQRARAGSRDAQAAEGMLNLFLGGATGFGTTSLEMTGELSALAAMLDAEKHGYQYLCLALLLVLVSSHLFLYSRNKRASPNPSPQM